MRTGASGATTLGISPAVGSRQSSPTPIRSDIAFFFFPSSHPGNQLTPSHSSPSILRVMTVSEGAYCKRQGGEPGKI